MGLEEELVPEDKPRSREGVSMGVNSERCRGPVPETVEKVRVDMYKLYDQRLPTYSLKITQK